MLFRKLKNFSRDAKAHGRKYALKKRLKRSRIFRKFANLCGYSLFQKIFREEKVNPLHNLFHNHNHPDRPIHKWVHYLDIYHRHMAKFIGKSPVILEIGVFKGGSLQMWKNYFGEGAIIVGVDIDESCRQYADVSNNIHVLIGDASEADFVNNTLLKLYDKYDIIIDDASHLADQQIKSFELLYEHVNYHGIYLVEDLHANYWPDWNTKNAYNQSNSNIDGGDFLDFVKQRGIDLMRYHFDEKGTPFYQRNSTAPEMRSREELTSVPAITSSTYAIHLYDSIVIFDKKFVPQPWTKMSYGRNGKK